MKSDQSQKKACVYRLCSPFSGPFILSCIADSEEVFSTYKHREVVKGCQPHPGDIVEAAPLAVSHACFVRGRESCICLAFMRGRESRMCCEREGVMHIYVLHL